MPQPNPRIPYRMAGEHRRLPPLDGKPLMVHVVVNVEYWPFERPMPRAVIPQPHGTATVPDVGNYAWVEYGMRVGMPRIHAHPRRTRHPGQCLHERVLRRHLSAVRRGHAGRRLGVRRSLLGCRRSLAAEDDEVAVIDRSLERLERLTGRRTRGWLGAGIGETFDTPDLLKERGVEWLADWYVDDLPCWMRTRHGPMIAMPYTVEHNDVPAVGGAEPVQRRDAENASRRRWR